MTKNTTGFPHQRLDAFHAAMELTIGVERLAAALPQGHADLKDQIRRAASATTRNIAEGANRWAPRDKAARSNRFRARAGERAHGRRMASGPRAAGGRVGVASATQRWRWCGAYD